MSAEISNSKLEISNGSRVRSPHQQAKPAPNESRRSLVAQQRRSGNGTAQDVADFFGVSKRTAWTWKDENKIGFHQVGECVWFSARDVAECGANNHHAAKYSKVAPSELPALIEQEWREFLAGAACTQFEKELKELKDRIERMENNFASAEAPLGMAAAKLGLEPSVKAMVCGSAAIPAGKACTHHEHKEAA